MKTDKHKRESLAHAIPEFLRFNIVENDISGIIERDKRDKNVFAGLIPPNADFPECDGHAKSKMV